MISSMTMKDVATFDKCGIQIKDLDKVNFIYGGNGSGKTTISKFLQNPEQTEFGNCSIVWELGAEAPVFVYNKRFIDQNFGKGTIDGVFTLGQATKEQVEELEKTRLELNAIKALGIDKKMELEKINADKTKLESSFKEELWSGIYKKYETIFKEAFIGAKTKESFKNKILDEFKNNKAELFSYEYLKGKAQVIFGNAPQSLPKINNLEFSKILEIEDNKIWQKKILGKSDIDIAKLIQSMDLNDWVNKGREYIQENNQICPFCQQNTITENFKTQIENYFDEEFINDTNYAKSLSLEYNRLANEIAKDLLQIEASENDNPDTKLDMKPFSAYIKSLNNRLLSNNEILNTKIKEPSRAVELNKIREDLGIIQELIIEANIEIEKHNAVVSNYGVEKSRLVAAIWRFLITDNKSLIDNFNSHLIRLQNDIMAATESIESLRMDYKKLDWKIKELTKNTTSVQPTIDEINATLAEFGILNFRIAASGSGANQYEIQRQDGALAESTLSDGEISFITFLYFMQLAKGNASKDKIVEDRIFVIDDPVSNLDSNLIFVVCEMIKGLIKSIRNGIGSVKQLILLAHNSDFLNKVSNIYASEKECDSARFWSLSKNETISSIQFYGSENPLRNSQ